MNQLNPHSSIMSPKVPLCIMLPEHFSSHLGGAEYQASLLTRALCNSNKYEITYLCQRADKNYAPQGYKLIVTGQQYLPGRPLSFLAAKDIYATLNKIRPAIIYQNVGGIQTGVAGYYAKKKNIKFIWHIASDDDITPQWKSNLTRTLRTIPERIFINYGIKNATVIAAQTRFQANLLNEKFGIDCKGFIPIGHPFPTTQAVKSGLVTVLWIANLKPLKRPELFVRLAQHFYNREDVRFIMIGREGWGPWYDRLRAKIGELRNLEYVGELSQTQVNEHLNYGHILVNTSRYEGFSNTFVQAWMRNVPVVSLTVDPDQILVREKIGFQSGTFENLCRDVNTLVSDDAVRTDYAERGCRYAREHHNVDKMVANAIQLFQL